MRGLFGSLVVALSVVGGNVSAGEFVEIVSGAEQASVRVVGYMARPLGQDPFSAVVLLHGCGGFHSAMISWADRLSRFGYAALAVDSFGPRGFEERCVGGFLEQVGDGYAALRYLATRPFVRASHVAAMGFSQGGWAVLTALEKSPMEQRQPETFRAGVAFYPLCQQASGITTRPLLIVVGDADDWTPASSCEAMAAGRTELGGLRGPGDRSLLELVVLPGAHHGFDYMDLSLATGRGVWSYGHRVEYNEEATRNAIVKVRDFLQRTIGVP